MRIPKDLLHHLLTCEYPPVLADLAQLLTDDDSAVVLQSWAQCSPCALAKFAQVVVNALEYDSSAAMVIQKSCRILAIRDALLEYKPGLLDGLLRVTLEKNISQVACRIREQADESFT
ncbi:hypothetical protein NEOLI_001805, partial [Neolecta irregularis DAH-3]